MKKTLLLIGKSGILGSAFLEKAKELKGYKVLAPAATELDLKNELKIRYYFMHNDIDVILNCAAINDIPSCETKKGYEIAQMVNNYAVEKLMKHAKPEAKIIQISCDEVYGNSNRIINEDDETWPASSYGYTKEQADNYLKFNCKDRSIIIRTQWLYGKDTYTDFKTIAFNTPILYASTDKIGSPTYAGDLADAIVKILNNEFKPGIYHYTNEGVCSLYDFMYEIAKYYKKENIIKAGCSEEHVRRIAILSKNKIEVAYGIEIPQWRESLERIFRGTL